MNRLAILWMSLSCIFLIACTSVEEQQARLEQARASYREQQLSARTTESQQKLAAWQKQLDSVTRAEFHRTEETLGALVPPVKAVSVSGAELKELIAILRRGHPSPLPDADILTRPGSEPLQLNADGEVESIPPLHPIPVMLPHNFFAIDTLLLYNARGERVEPTISPFGDIVSRTEAEQQRNNYTDDDRPFIMLEDADYQRFRKLPSYRRFVERMKKAHATGKWDITPDFSEL
ncbi:MAG: hypothetical protein IKL98_04595 [Akkermansia sp.]|nr:hypothetical protein [Akkermansia sp.]